MIDAAHIDGKGVRQRHARALDATGLGTQKLPRMPGEQKIVPAGIKEPIQLLAAGLAALIVVDSALLTAARLIGSPRWAAGALVITAIAIIPLFLIGPFLLVKFFRGELLPNRDWVDLQKRLLETATQKVKADFGDIGPLIDELSLLDKASVEELAEKLEALDQSKPAVLTLILGKRERTSKVLGYYEPVDLGHYLNALRQYRSFKGIAVCDKEKRPKAYIPYDATVTMVIKSDVYYGTETEQDAITTFVNRVNNAEIEEIRRSPGVVTKYLNQNMTNLGALSKLAELRLEDCLVVDGDGRLRGVINKQDLVAKIALAVSGSPPANVEAERGRHRRVRGKQISTGDR